MQRAPGKKSRARKQLALDEKFVKIPSGVFLNLVIFSASAIWGGMNALLVNENYTVRIRRNIFFMLFSASV